MNRLLLLSLWLYFVMMGVVAMATYQHHGQILVKPVQVIDSGGNPTPIYVVVVSYSASPTPGVVNYKIYKGTSCLSGNVIVTTSNLTYVDHAVGTGQTWSYWATAVDSFSQESVPSNCATVVIP